MKTKLEDILSDDSDLVYHYTTREAALEHILHDRKLRLSKLSRATDPFESLFGKNPLGVTANISEEEIHLLSWAMDMVDRERNIFKDSSWFVSFCMSQSNRPTDGKNPDIKDRLGFLKARMWDQYGQGFKGVCLAFSKSDLQKEAKSKSHWKCFCENLSYVPHHQLPMNDVQKACEKKKRLKDAYTFESFFDDRYQLLYFLKHQDFRDEDEWRICVTDEKVDNEYIFLDCGSALRAICYCHDHENQQMPELFPSAYIPLMKSHSETFEVPIIEIAWTERDISAFFMNPEKNFEHEEMLF